MQATMEANNTKRKFSDISKINNSDILARYLHQMQETGSSIQPEIGGIDIPGKLLYYRLPPPGSEPWKNAEFYVLLGSLAGLENHEKATLICNNSAKNKNPVILPATWAYSEVKKNADLKGKSTELNVTFQPFEVYKFYGPQLLAKNVTPGSFVVVRDLRLETKRSKKIDESTKIEREVTYIFPTILGMDKLSSVSFATELGAFIQSGVVPQWIPRYDPTERMSFLDPIRTFIMDIKMGGETRHTNVEGDEFTLKPVLDTTIRDYDRIKYNTNNKDLKPQIGLKFLVFGTQKMVSREIKEWFTIRVAMYREQALALGIYDKITWEWLVSTYANWIHMILYCAVDWKRTKKCPENAASFTPKEEAIYAKGENSDEWNLGENDDLNEMLNQGGGESKSVTKDTNMISEIEVFSYAARVVDVSFDARAFYSKIGIPVSRLRAGQLLSDRRSLGLHEDDESKHARMVNMQTTLSRSGIVCVSEDAPGVAKVFKLDNVQEWRAVVPLPAVTDDLLDWIRQLSAVDGDALINAMYSERIEIVELSPVAKKILSHIHTAAREGINKAVKPCVFAIFGSKLKFACEGQVMRSFTHGLDIHDDAVVDRKTDNPPIHDASSIDATTAITTTTTAHAAAAGTKITTTKVVNAPNDLQQLLDEEMEDGDKAGDYYGDRLNIPALVDSIVANSRKQPLIPATVGATVQKKPAGEAAPTKRIRRK